VCPYLEQSEARCAAHLSLSKLQEALGFCAADYESCPVYRQLVVNDALCRNTYQSEQNVLAG
jgi:hypothetical protein